MTIICVRSWGIIFEIKWTLKSKEKGLMEILTTEKHEFAGYKIVEHIMMLQDKMVFIDKDTIPLCPYSDDLPEEELLDDGDRFCLEKELVKEELIMAAREEGANAIIGLKFEVCLAGGVYIAVYGNGTAVRLERV